MKNQQGVGGGGGGAFAPPPPPPFRLGLSTMFWDVFNNWSEFNFEVLHKVVKRSAACESEYKYKFE